MSADPNRLLFVMSARGSMTWTQYREAVDCLSASAPTQERQLDGRASRSGLLQCLEALGHCDVLYEQGKSTISITPSTLCRLPKSGLPKAVLTGARSLGTYEEMLAAADSCGGKVQVEAESHPGPMGLLPDLIRVSATSEEAMAAYSDILKIRYAETPSAWTLVNWCGTLFEYQAMLDFCRDDGLNWARYDFDVNTYEFGRDTPEVFPRYSRFRNPKTGLPMHVFYPDRLGAEVDLSWGRYLFLNARGITATAYDERRYRLCIPIRVPLPGVVARTVCMCSGKPPVHYQKANLLPGNNCQHWLMFEEVPPQIAWAALSKVGQTPTRVDIR